MGSLVRAQERELSPTGRWGFFFIYPNMTHYLYIIYSSAIDKYYVGVSANPWHRIEQHNTNSIEKYTGKTQDWQMKAVFFVSEELSEALKIEKFIKKQKSRKLIERLVNSADVVFDGALSQLVRVPYVRD